MYQIVCDTGIFLTDWIVMTLTLSCLSDVQALSHYMIPLDTKLIYRNWRFGQFTFFIWFWRTLWIFMLCKHSWRWTMASEFPIELLFAVGYTIIILWNTFKCPMCLQHLSAVLILSLWENLLKVSDIIMGYLWTQKHQLKKLTSWAFFPTPISTYHRVQKYPPKPPNKMKKWIMQWTWWCLHFNDWNLHYLLYKYISSNVVAALKHFYLHYIYNSFAIHFVNFAAEAKGI